MIASSIQPTTATLPPLEFVTEEKTENPFTEKSLREIVAQLRQDFPDNLAELPKRKWKERREKLIESYGSKSYVKNIQKIFLWWENLTSEQQKSLYALDEYIRFWPIELLVALSKVPLTEFQKCQDKLAHVAKEQDFFVAEDWCKAVKEFHPHNKKTLILEEKVTDEDLELLFKKKFELTVEQWRIIEQRRQDNNFTNNELADLLEDWGYAVEKLLTINGKRNRQHQKTQQRLEEERRINQEIKAEHKRRIQEIRQETGLKIQQIQEEKDHQINSLQAQITALHEEKTSKAQENATETEAPESATQINKEENIEPESEEINSVTPPVNQAAIKSEKDATETAIEENRGQNQRKAMPFEPKPKNQRNKAKGFAKGKSSKNRRNPSHQTPPPNQGSKPPNRATSTGFWKR